MIPITVQLRHKDELIALRVLAAYRLGLIDYITAIAELSECCTVIDNMEVNNDLA